MKIKFPLLLLTFSLLLAGCFPGKGALVLKKENNLYLHDQSGFSFPPSIGKFKRDDNVIFYDDSGNNFSVPYNIEEGQKAIATIYIYPSLRDYNITPIPKLGQTPEWFLNQEYGSAKASIINKYNARVVSESEYNINRSLLNPDGKKSTFEWDTMNGETVNSHLYLFSHNGWLVKYRFSYLNKYKDTTEPEIENFITSFKWPL